MCLWFLLFFQNIFLNEAPFRNGMCGILGVLGHAKRQEFVAEGLRIMHARGIDGSDIYSDTEICMGHLLHAMVGQVAQPLTIGNIVLVVNCEIYNWKALAATYGITARNDAELLATIFSTMHTHEEILAVLNQLDGSYAFALYLRREKQIILARDILGIKPLWYAYSDFLSFSSEKKALLQNNILDVLEVNPRTLLLYDIASKQLQHIPRAFFSIYPEHTVSLPEMQKEVHRLLQEAVAKRLPGQRVGVLFSGGIDSVYIAWLLKQAGAEVVCYTAAFDCVGMEPAPDLLASRKAAALLQLPLIETHATLADIERELPIIIERIESANVVKVGVALPFHFCCAKAHDDGIKVMFSGLGSEEIFAGYERHGESKNVNEECLSGLRQMHERDLYRDDVITMAHSIELRLPFLDKDVVAYGLRIPAIHKLNNEQKKIILREAALQGGVPEELVWRKKKAAQYGSKFNQAIEKLAKKHDYSSKATYLASLNNIRDSKLGVLWSSGKDSAYAAYLMQSHNYDISCLLTMKSKNQDSYMFHTPGIEISTLQAEAMELPILIQETEGHEESELEDLFLLLQRAKEQYHINGIVTGALFSQYQRERIEKVADRAGLTVFSPLWHKNQEQEMRELLQQGFNILFTSVAAEGLDASWLGRLITERDVDKLVSLNISHGINIAGEGGEFESLVLDCPLFKRRIELLETEIKKDGLAARLLIRKARVS